MSIRALRALTTLYLSLAIGQAGFGSGLLDGMGNLLLFHAINAYLVVGVGIACLVGGILYRREGGPLWPIVFTGALVVVSITQAVLGQADVRGPHIFLGILFLSGVTTLCSYVWRHKPAAGTTPTGSGPSRRGAKDAQASGTAGTAGTAGTTVPPAAPAGGTAAG